MKPVDQTVFGYPNGNCFSACLASILELPLEEVPWFMAEGDWLSRVQEWLKPRGLYAACLLIDTTESPFYPPGWHILSGQSPRGDWLHAVVAQGTKIVHDPHPDKTGLVNHKDTLILIALDPTTCRVA